MMTRCAFVRAAIMALALFTTPLVAQPAPEVENVTAFARLYGVVRWFYPSDAAATLDWNRFAVEGVRTVRAARTPAELEVALERLFAPLGTGIDIGVTLPPSRPVGPRDRDLVAWHHRGPGFSNIGSGAYFSRRLNRAIPAPPGQQPAFSVVSQLLAADSLRGREIRLRGLVRSTNAKAEGWAGLWLRVDRGKAVGFFDNMQDRPVRDTSWREYVIQGTVDADATQIVFGALSVGDMSVDVDAIEVAVRNIAGAWTPLAVRDASFEDQSFIAPAWTQNATAQFVRPTDGAPDGKRYLRIPPTGGPRTGVGIARAADSLETPRRDAVSEFVLSRGLRARVALSLTDAEARMETPGLTALWTALAALPPTSTSDDLDVRLADVVVAWSVLRHFYPYWNDLSVDWDARLGPQLAAAREAAATRQGHRDALRLLVADLQDGHGGVNDIGVPPRVAQVPVQLRLLANAANLPVVTASREASVPVGSVITMFDGEPADKVVANELRLASGTPQWKRTRAEWALPVCRRDAEVTWRIEPPGGPARGVTLRCPSTVAAVNEARPDSIAQLQPGIWYVDLTRVRAEQLRPVLSTLSTARGVIFDLRGYPTDAGAAVLPHLMRTAELPTDRWMHVPRFAQPFAAVAGWDDLTWGLRPTSPLITGPRVFLTDGRAISYAESVMGYVRDYQLGTIIGGSTAGANGNVAGFVVPGGFSVMFTGMRVSRHDGRTAFHTVGVAPDVPLEPTLDGIRAGKDEVLARALSVLGIRP